MAQSDTQIEWKPNKRQEDVLKLPDSVFEVLYGGAAGSGKTDLAVFLPIVREFHTYPRYKGIIFRRTFPELESEVIQRAHQIYPLAGGRYSDKYHRYIFPSGAIVQFGHCEHDEDIRKYDSAEYQTASFDELTSFNQFPYVYFIGSRMRTADSRLPLLVRSGTNPGNVGHAWVYKRFVQFAESGYKIVKDPLSGLKRIFIPARVTDNTALMEADPTYVQKLKLLEGSEYRAKALGDWKAYEGQVFDEFRIEPYPGEPDNAKHVIESFPIPEWWPQILTIDWGFKAMLWAAFLAVSPDKRVYLHTEYSRFRTKIAEWAADLSRLSQNINLVDVVMCHSAWQDRGDPKTIAIQFAEIFGKMPRQADNDRVSGKMLVHEFLRWKPRPPKFIPPEGFQQELAERIFRMHGEKAMRSYYDQFLPDAPETNLPRLLIFKHNKDIIQSIQSCVYNTKNDKKREDVAEFDGDDPYDGLRYGLKAVDYFTNAARKEFESQHELSKIMENFNRTHDFTYLHHAMDRHERKRTRKDTPVFTGARMRAMRSFKRTAGVRAF